MRMSREKEGAHSMNKMGGISLIESPTKGKDKDIGGGRALFHSTGEMRPLWRKLRRA